MGNQTSTIDLLSSDLVIGNNVQGLFSQKEALVVSSGGLYLFDMFGFFEIFKKNRLLDSFRIFVGVSAGAIITTMLTSRDLDIRDLSEKIIQKFFPSTFQRVGPYNAYQLLAHGYLAVNSELKRNLLSFVIEQSFGNPNITMREHFELTGKLLVIVLTNLSDLTVFNAHVFNCPNVRLYDLIDASSSIPYVWSPKKINVPGLGEKYFVDGAVVNTYPINVFMPDCSLSALNIPREQFFVPTLDSGKILGLRIRNINSSQEALFNTSVLEEKPEPDMPLLKLLRVMTRNSSMAQDLFLTKKVLDNTILIENFVPLTISERITPNKATISYNNGTRLASELLSRIRDQGSFILS